MREITVKLYQFDELPTEEAMERAREWFREGANEMEYAWDHIKDDAKTVGLVIESLDQHRANRGRFVNGPLECAQAIVKEHGKPCETFKTAEAFIKEHDEIVALEPRDDDGGLDDVALDKKLEEAEEQFLYDILEDYRIMLEKEYEYQNSDEVVDENIRCNEYEFTEDGRRAE